MELPRSPGTAPRAGPLSRKGGRGARAVSLRGAALLAALCFSLAGGRAAGTDCYEEIDPYYWNFDVPSMIHVGTPRQAAAVRAAVIDYLWAGAGYPGTRLPSVQHLPCSGDPPPPRGPYPGDFPTTVSGLALWLDAADSPTIAQLGGRISRWSDKSGFGNHAVQATSGLQPLYQAAGINGKGAVSFDGADDYLEIPEDASLDAAHPTLLVVVQPSTANLGNSPVALAKQPMGGAYQITMDAAGTPVALVNIDGQTSSTSDMGPVTGSAEVWSVRHDGQTLRMRRNMWASEGSPVAVGSVQTTSGPLRIGGGDGGSVSALAGSIAEVLLYNRTLSEAELRSLEDYLGWKYGIYQAWPGWIGRLGSANVGCVDRLDVAMDSGLHSYAYLLRPAANPANRLLIFHQGHSEFLLTNGGQQVMRYFLDRGFAVMAFWMPLFGENPKTLTDLYGSTLTLGNHDLMAEYLEDSRGGFIRFFLEPVVAGLNYVSSELSFDDVNMVGISGGGWTTHLLSALDTRIAGSFPTAGSLPLYLHDGPCPNGTQGDAEQYWPPLYQDRAGYLDLYVLGGYGPGRGQIQILNQYDSCCFYGVNYRTYAPDASAAAAGLGSGSFSVYLDSTHAEHKISDSVIDGVIYPAISAETLPYRPETDLALAQSHAPPDPLPLGVPFTCTLQVANNGPSRAGNVLLTDALPAGAVLLSATPSQGSCAMAVPVTCQLGEIPEGGSAQVSLAVLPVASGPMSNSAQVSYELPDFLPANNLSLDASLVLAPDQDADGVPDGADCAPLDAAAFAIPGEVTGVRFDADGETIRWDSAVPGAGPGTLHDLLRGNVQDLASRIDQPADCLVQGSEATLAADVAVPLEGQAFWYLVRGRNLCGAGTLGSGSAGGRSITGCP
jgi:uncharacterized repeat protein (TIGR01451 family)